MRPGLGRGYALCLVRRKKGTNKPVITLHLLGMPYADTIRGNSWCPYTQKARNLATMMSSLGYRVVLYGGEANDADVAEHVVVNTMAKQRDWFGDRVGADRITIPSLWDPVARWWTESNDAAVDEIKRRAKPGDILGITMGVAQRSPIGVRDLGCRLTQSAVPVAVGRSIRNGSGHKGRHLCRRARNGLDWSERREARAAFVRPVAAESESP